MARLLPLSKDKTLCDNTLVKTLQSGHISFLLGSGASYPAIPIAGSIEKELNELLDTNPKEFTEKKLGFLTEIQKVTNKILSGKLADSELESTNNYREFLEILGGILEERKTALLSKQITIFTTNYDVLIEHAAQDLVSIRLNDGFNRTPSLTNGFRFQPEHFFDFLQKTGNLFNYSFSIPGINLVKLHGSLTWAQSSGELFFRSGSADVPDLNDTNSVKLIEEFENKFALILPTKQKFNQTIMERVYYDLLRILANTLEIENTALISFGFSFEDEHILEITRRALKNPTLLLIIFAHEETSIAGYKQKFDRYNNVLIVHPSNNEKIDFGVLNKLFAEVIPKIHHEN